MEEFVFCVSLVKAEDGWDYSVGVSYVSGLVMLLMNMKLNIDYEEKVLNC